MTKNKTILLAAGGTGGHLFPALALAEELKQFKTTIHLVTDIRCKKYLTKNLPVTTHIIDIHLKMSGMLSKIKSILQLLLACIKALFLIKKINPDVIVGFGGYPSFPPMFAAKLLNIPIIIQEQNCFLGKSNRFFTKSAKIIALSYENKKNIDPEHRSKTLVIGDILRRSIKDLSKKTNFNAKKTFHIFVVGGSQGAKIFSTLIPNVLKKLRESNPDIKISITQQVANIEKEKLAELYESLNLEYELSDFFHNISEIYDKSQLVISRAGASTIAELSYIGLPAIFIPLPHAMENHQYFNAKSIADGGGGWCYKQSNISPEILAHKINELISDRTLLIKASAKLLNRKTDGAKYFADTILKKI